MNLQKEAACMQGELETKKQIGQYSLQLICPAAMVSLVFTTTCENRGVFENTERENSEQFFS